MFETMMVATVDMGKILPNILQTSLSEFRLKLFGKSIQNSRADLPKCIFRK